MTRRRTIRELLDATREMQDERVRVQALKEMSPYVPPALQSDLLAIASEIQNEQFRAEALGVVAPYLGEGLKSQLLAATLRIRGDFAGRALVNIAPFLPQSLQLDLLVAVRALHAPSLVWSLGPVARSLPVALAQAILAAARSIQDKSCRAEALKKLVPFLPEKLHSELLAAQRDLFAEVCAIKDEQAREPELCSVAPYLPDVLQPDVLAAACTLQDEDCRSWVLGVVVISLPEVLKPDLLSAVRAIQNESYRARALKEVAPFLPKTLHSELLMAICTIQDEDLRALVVETISNSFLITRGLAEAAKPDLLSVARAIRSRPARAKALQAVAPVLPKALDPELLAAQHDLLTEVRTIQDEGTRARALIEVAPTLIYFGRECELFTELREIPDKEAQATALQGLAEAMGAGELERFKPDLLAAARQIGFDWLITHFEDLVRRAFIRGSKVSAPVPPGLRDLVRARTSPETPTLEAPKRDGAEVPKMGEQPAARGIFVPEPPPRYADYTFYKESESGSRIERLSTEMPLKMGLRYQLEVAVRVRPTGITSEKERKPTEEPRKNEPVEIIVAATSKYFYIPQPVQKLILPPMGDSVENAYFPGVEPRYATGSGSLLSLQIRLYYKHNLLEVGKIEAEVVGPLELDISSRLGIPQPIRLSQERLEQEYEDFDLVQPREMHIDVSREQTGAVQFNFILDRGKKNEIALTGNSQIGEQELESTLLGIRRVLQGVTVWDEFGSGIEGKDQARFDSAMNKLARLGSSLRNEIFFRDEKSSMFIIGEWLRHNPLPSGSTIQVSIAPTASTYIFPWSILYDKDVPHNDDEGPDLEGFWGLRYVIEQFIPGAQNKSDEVISIEGTLELGYLLSRFNEAIDQQQFLDGLVQRSQGRIGRLMPIDTRDSAYEYLRNCTSNIVYFFAHGHTQFPNANRYGFSSDDFVKLYDALPSSSPLRASWAQICDDLKKGLYDSDESWIKLANGKLLLETLYDPGQLNLLKRPVVFLNMCESAQVTPTAGRSFIHVFMNRGARDVLGTECAMRPFVAHRLASQFFEGLLSGTSIGEVLLELRRNLMERKNPLGLAYTLYGPATTKFEPPPLPETLRNSGAEETHQS